MDLEDGDFSSQQQLLSFKKDDTTCSYSSELALETPIYKNGSFEACNMDDILSESSATEQQHLPQELQQAQEEFHKVMGLLQNVLEQKLSEQPTCTMQAEPSQDPFYKYLESILSRVETAARADIQLELLNFANTLVKNAKAQSTNL